MELVTSIKIGLPSFWLVFPPVVVETNVLKLHSPTAGVVHRKASRFAWLGKFVPAVGVRHVVWRVCFLGDVSWTSEIVIDALVVNVKDLGASFENLVGTASCVGISGEFLKVKKFKFAKNSINIDLLHFTLDIEKYYAIIPTLGPLLRPSVETAAPATVASSLHFVAAIEQLSFSAQCKTVGSCRMDFLRVAGRLEGAANFLKCAGCTMSRTSPTYGQADMARVAPFTMTGTKDELNFDIPRATIFTAPEGIVFWVRALIMVGAKASATKRPERVAIKNLRTKIFYDFELSGIEPISWTGIANYVVKIVPIRVRLAFSSSLEILTDKNERILTEDALIDCNLPEMEINVSANSIEVFGLSNRRCALIKKFQAWIPQLSGPLLKDTDTSKFGKPSSACAAHHVPVSALGPIPIAIAFSDVTVEMAQDLIMLIGSQIFQAAEENIRKWTVNTGYYIVPFYKPVTVRLSRVRFAPAELAPVVLDVKDWELAIGPTKDCLSFAFLGIKAWVPSTVTVPPLIYVPEPALIDLRVKRLKPLSKVLIQSDYSMQPGSWRDLTLRVPAVRGAVAPGLHATTRFIDGMMKTIKLSIRPSGITPVPTPQTSPHNTSQMSKGPVKNVSVVCDSVFIEVARQATVLASLTLGRVELEIGHMHKLELASLQMHVGEVATFSLSNSSVLSEDGLVYVCEISRSLRKPVVLALTDNAMAAYSAYSALRDAFSKAWFLATPIPKLHTVLQMVEEPLEGGLVNGKIFFAFPAGIEFTWAVPRAHSGRLEAIVPANSLSGEAVFHGFTLFHVARKYPTLTDSVLVQWLRYPWTVKASAPNTAPASPSLSREKESWGLHGVMTDRIIDFLNFTHEEDCHWEYRSARGLIDTPVYLQLQVDLCNVELLLGGRRLAGIDRMEIKGHCHNLPTEPHLAAEEIPKVKLSYWMSWFQETDSLALDLVPEIHVPLILQLVGSPADADKDSSAVSTVAAAPSFLNLVLDRVDLGFRVTIYELSGRAANWVFGSSRIALFKEEEMIVGEVKNFKIAARSSSSLQASFQHLHSRVCPRHDVSVDQEVLPFLSVRQMMLHVGLPGPAQISLFCNIQGGRLWWSPALNRAMRLSLNRTDALAELIKRWKVRFTSDLFARLGKTKKHRRTLESILQFLEWFSGGRTARLVIRCADVQANMHNVGVDDLFEPTNSTPPRSPMIPKHFQPFEDVSNLFTPVQTPVARILRIESCDCVTAMDPADYKLYEKHLRRNPLNLEIPKIVSWAVRATHLQNSPLPPIPLALFYSPPSSSRERAIGALKYEVWKLDEGSLEAIRPKPRGSQLLLSSKEAVFELVISRSKGIDVDFNASFQEVHGSVAPTALRGLIWLGKPGETILREILTIKKIILVLNSELFPLKSAKLRFLIPKVAVSADDDAFHLITDVLRNCLLYRGALVDPDSDGSARISGPNNVGGTRFSGPVPANKREAIVEGLLTSLAVADANLPPISNILSAEYIIESISVILTHRQRCFVQLHLVAAMGKHTFAVSHPHRPMQFSFQIRDVQIEGANSRTVLESASGSGGNLLTLRGSDRYITLNNREWQVYDTLFLSVSPIAVDVNQELIEELYLFLFPVESTHEHTTNLPPIAGLETLEEQASEFEVVVGHKLLSDRNKRKAKRNSLVNSDSRSVMSDTKSVTHSETASLRKEPTSAGQPIFFKFVRFSNIDSVITFKGKQFSLNNMNLTLKYYLKRRRLATWKEFLDEWGSKVGKQAFGSFVKHGFSRKKALQEIIVNKLNAAHASDIDKLLFGKHAPKR